LINNAFVEMETELAAGNSGNKMVDLEDLAPIKTSSSGQAIVSSEKREMVTKLQRKALTKEGYKIIGSHSAVKLCRWTKNQLRGRGGCYKHSFYGITSYQCMEATPSLACANKCVFCWRHHKNPVGTEWRWKEDDPEFIVQQAIVLHVNMIKQMKGVPGVLLERLTEAHTVRHCALSLVGEPIMYPRINEMLRALHTREISSFLVTNAQFPERIEQLDPVTQLYVSVDAATKDSLKAIDRPLFKDFWERYLASLSALKQRKQRTVYRMTLVKSWNMEELDGYAELVEYGTPDFIEIKAVTYCGKSDASTLTMQNVPWHDDVCQYAEELCKRLTFRNRCQIQYSIATEHQHSCCILLAREDKFKVNGQWHTWIDYPKFHQLMRNFYETGESFSSEDYMAKTPDWAVYQSQERGFDPLEQRWRRKDGKDASGSTVDPTLIPDANESGCG
ncbi:4-demethylwyosine synthase TYW1, partial [archaeon]